MTLNNEKKNYTTEKIHAISPKLSISKFGETYLPSVNRNNFETIDSRTLYDKKFKNSFAITDTLNVIIGLDSGLLLKYVMDNPIPDGSKFLFIELQDILSLLSIEIPDKHKNTINICNENTFIEYLESDTSDIYILKKKCILHPSIAVSHEHIENYTELYNKVENIIESKTSNYQINFSQKIFTKAQFENISEMTYPAKLLRMVSPKRTAVIIGGGPSMDEHISWIKKNRTNLVVLAVSRIADKLISNNIIPDFVITVDPQDLSFDVNRELMQHFDKFILIFSFHACPRIVNQWQGKSMYLGNKFPWKEEDNIPTIGPTVSNSAIRIALEMGCTQILLSGVDFCYSQSGYTHVKGTLEANIGPNLGQICEWVETYNSLQAETPMPLMYAIESLQNEVALYDKVDFINLSINAAKVKGVRYCNIENIRIKNNSSPSVEKNLFTDKKQVESICLAIKNINENLSNLSFYLKKTNEALKLANEIESIVNSPNKIILYTRKINIIENQLDNNNPELIKLIKTFGLYEISKSLSSRDSSDWDQKTINMMHKSYFSALKLSIETLIKLTNQSLERLKSRLKEFDEKSDLLALSNQWKKDNQPGRVFIWLDKQLKRQQQLSTKEIETINSLKSDFNSQIKNINLSYKNKVTSSNELTNIFRKVSHLIKTKNIPGLYYVLSCLKPFKKNNADFNRLSIYINAKIFELENKLDFALDKVLEIPIEQCSEYELKLTIKLALKKLNLTIAEKYLVEILKISSEYMPQYADLLRLQGRLTKSLNIYLDYLNDYPSDVLTWLKLGALMIEAEQFESAKFAFSKVLIADPKNRIATEYIKEIESKLQKNNLS